jgi:hypothetical protein
LLEIPELGITHHPPEKHAAPGIILPLAGTQFPALLGQKNLLHLLLLPVYFANKHEVSHLVRTWGRELMPKAMLEKPLSHNLHLLYDSNAGERFGRFSRGLRSRSVHLAPRRQCYK